MNRKQRAEAVKTATSAEWRRAGGKRLEKVRNGRRLVITKEPDFILNADGEIIGVDVWVQLFEADGKTEVPIDPHRRIINPPTVPRSGIRETRDASGRVVSRELTPDPLAAFYEAVWDSIETAPNAKGWRTRGTVTTIFGDTADGTVRSFNTSYSTARAGSSLAVISAGSGEDGRVGQFLNTAAGGHFCYESFFAFDTSAIDDADNVTSVTLEMVIRSRNLDNDFTVEVRAYDWGESVTTGDWVAGGSLGAFDLAASATASSGTIGGYQAFTSEPAFLTAPNLKTGFVRLLVNSSRHRLGQAPPSNFDDEYIDYYTADQAGTSQDPKLTIVHEAGAEEHSGGSTAAVTVTAGGSGRAGAPGGASAAVEVTPSGAGEPQTAGGSTTVVNVTPSGAGEPQTAGGSAATVNVATSGTGEPQTAGGASATVNVAATGHGVSGSASGGSSAVVEVAASGGGIARFRSDLNVIVGRSRTGYAVGPSRVGNTVGPSRVERGE